MVGRWMLVGRQESLVGGCSHHVPSPTRRAIGGQTSAPSESTPVGAVLPWTLDRP